MSTISLSNIGELTASVGAPRVAAIEHPGSQPLGPAGDADRQRQVLSATLAALEAMETPGEVTALPFVWPRGAPKALRPKALPPIAKLLMKKPWLLSKLISGDLPNGLPA